MTRRSRTAPARRRAASGRGPAGRLRPLLLPAAVLVIVAGLAIAAFVGGDDDPAETDGQELAADVADADDPTDVLARLERRDPDDPLAIGDVDAPVVMIEWADFQCPFCGSFARDTKPMLEERFVDEGILRIEWRDLAVLGEESRLAALAGRAAGEQGAFWELHDEIFAEDRDRNAGELDRDSLVAMADDLGLDTDRLEQDMQDQALATAADTDRQLAQTLGFTGTPSFLINGRTLVGGQPADVFVEAVEQAAQEAQDAGS